MLAERGRPSQSGGNRIFGLGGQIQGTTLGRISCVDPFCTRIFSVRTKYSLLTTGMLILCQTHLQVVSVVNHAVAESGYNLPFGVAIQIEIAQVLANIDNGVVDFFVVITLGEVVVQAAAHPFSIYLIYSDGTSGHTKGVLVVSRVC